MCLSDHDEWLKTQHGALPEAIEVGQPTGLKSIIICFEYWIGRDVKVVETTQEVGNCVAILRDL